MIRTSVTLQSLVVVANDNKYVFITDRISQTTVHGCDYRSTSYFQYTRHTSTLNPEHGSETEVVSTM